MMEKTLEMCREARIQPFAANEEALQVDLEAFAQNNWDALAKTAGEPVDREAWEAYERAQVTAINSGTPVAVEIED